MSNNSGSSKKVTLEDLDFDGISGGVETRTPTEQITVTPQVRGLETLPQRNDYTIPIPVGDRLVMKNLRDVSGDEFLAWALSVCPMFKNQRHDPDLYDGPRNIENRKDIVNGIAKFYCDIMIRRGYNINTLH
jgi:hypothetical protein